jgi:hypothetical protein
VHDSLSEQIATLPTLNKAQLLAIWAENFNKDPPPQLHKRLMVALLAYRIQEKEFGGCPMRRGADYEKLLFR